MANDDRDEDLRKQFLRVRSVSTGVVLEVATVEWSGPDTPELRWEAVEQFLGIPSSSEQRSAERRVLDDPDFFRLCDICGKRHNIGHMHSELVCRGCAESLLGVAH